MTRALLTAGEELTKRLRILQKLQAQHREMGDTFVELNVAELFESSDLAAIDAWESAKADAMGQVALPFTVPVESVAS